MEAMRREPSGELAIPPARRVSVGSIGDASPFDLGEETAWRRWRAAKLAARPLQIEDLIVDVADLARPTAAERVALAAVLARANMVVYRGPALDEAAARRAVAAFAGAVGLRRFERHRSAAEDGIVAIRVTDAPRQAGFVPYSDRPLGWHTDGYYAWEGPDRAIRSMVLHCVRAAPHGGANALLDPEIAYLRLRDRDPALVAALMRPDALTIPPSVEEDGAVRAETTGPVFFLDPTTGRLAMRYTARKRHVVWCDDPVTRAAAAALVEITADDPAILRLRLAPGMGLLADNVLHDRSGFEDAEDPAEGRLLLRLRSFDPVALPRSEF